MLATAFAWGNMLHSCHLTVSQFLSLTFATSKFPCPFVPYPFHYTMREQTPLTVVAPDGDLIVGLGPDSTRTHTVRVSSHVLKLASPVFRTMLGPSFKEGSTVHNDDTPLDLLHVDPISMLNLFSALHYQPEKVDRAKVDWLQKLVFVCDQYMCIEAMKEYIHFQMCTPVSPIESLLDDLIIAALLGDERGFASASDNVIRVPVCLPEDEGHENLMKLAPELMLGEFSSGLRQNFC